MVPASYVIIRARFTTAVVPRAMFPAVFETHRPVGIRVSDPPELLIGHGAVIVTIFEVPDTNDTAEAGAIVVADAIVGAELLVAIKFEIIFWLTRVFDANILPVTVKLVSPGSPVIATTSKFAVDDTFRVVKFANGIVSVSKLKTVLVVFDVKPAVTMFVV